MQAKAEKITKIVAANVKAERLRAGLSQQRLAEKTGLSVRYISRLECSPQNIKIDKVAVIATAMGVPPDKLLREVEQTVVNPSVLDNLNEAIRLLQIVLSQCTTE
jgi:transcriptional regulator with XRE-family HTH domain